MRQGPGRLGRRPLFLWTRTILLFTSPAENYIIIPLSRDFLWIPRCRKGDIYL